MERGVSLAAEVADSVENEAMEDEETYVTTCVGRHLVQVYEAYGAYGGCVVYVEY